MDTGIQSAIIGSTGTILVSLIGIGLVLSQISSQFRQNRESIKETEKRRFKTEFFEKSISVSEEFANASIDLQTSLLTTQQSVEIATGMAKLEQPFPIPSQRVMDLLQLHSDFGEKAVNLIRLVESRLVLDPRLAVFKNAIQSVTHDVREVFQKKYFTIAMHSLPTDRPDGGIFDYKPPADNEELISMTKSLTESLSDALSYSNDFEVEMQNLLLSDLFEKTAPHRTPLDISHKVIQLDNFDQLNSYFLNETAWGKMCNSIDDETKKAIESKTRKIV